jgi:hypothetical protein
MWHCSTHAPSQLYTLHTGTYLPSICPLLHPCPAYVAVQLHLQVAALSLARQPSSSSSSSSSSWRLAVGALASPLVQQQQQQQQVVTVWQMTQ